MVVIFIFIVLFASIYQIETPSVKLSLAAAAAGFLAGLLPVSCGSIAAPLQFSCGSFAAHLCLGTFVRAMAAEMSRENFP